MLSASWVIAESGSWTGDGLDDFWNNNANWSGATYPERRPPRAMPRVLTWGNRMKLFNGFVSLIE